MFSIRSISTVGKPASRKYCMWLLFLFYLCQQRRVLIRSYRVHLNRKFYVCFCWHLLGLQGSCWLRYKGLLPASPNYIRSRKEYLLCSKLPRVPVFPYCLLLVAKLSSQEQSSQGSRLLGWASCSGPLSEVLMAASWKKEAEKSWCG